MFTEALNAFDDVRGVRAFWKSGGDMSDNFDAYQANLAKGMSPAEAAANTFTGHMATTYYGFGNITVDPSSNASVVKVDFGG